ncbi:hypothetical protein GLOIN_2v1476779, partial [Rhizophagus irregularis DAOM 181602=DAOM 197198]
ALILSPLQAHYLKRELISRHIRPDILSLHNMELQKTCKFKQKEIKGEGWSNTFGRGVYHLVLAILQYIETFNPEVSFTGTINNVKIDSTSLLNDLFATLVKEAKKFNRITVSVVIVVIPGDDFVGIAYDYDLESQYKNDDLEQCQIQFL